MPTSLNDAFSESKLLLPASPEPKRFHVGSSSVNNFEDATKAIDAYDDSYVLVCKEIYDR